MARRHPLQRRITCQKRLIEDNLLVLAAKPAEARLLPLAYGLKRARYLSDAVDVSIFLDWFRMDASDGAGGDEEILDHLGDQAPLARLCRLPKKCTEIQLALR